jgi:serine/threonine protein kinase
MYFISTKDAYRLNNKKFSEALCDFVARCLEKDIKRRWSIQQLLQHRFITAIGNGNQERQIFANMIRNKKDVSLSDLIAQS